MIKVVTTQILTTSMLPVRLDDDISDDNVDYNNDDDKMMMMIVMMMKVSPAMIMTMMTAEQCGLPPYL